MAMNKTETKQYVREMMLKYEDQHMLCPEDLSFMLEVLNGHPDSAGKIGPGVKKMWIAINAKFGGRNFWLERMDGTTTDFSFIKCLTKQTAKGDFLKACREAVSDTIIRFRDGVFGTSTHIICPLSNQAITKNESHIDHTGEHQFINIAQMFSEEEKINFETIEYSRGIGLSFADRTFKNRWIDFHNKYAVLRVISAEENQKLPKKKWEN